MMHSLFVLTFYCFIFWFLFYVISESLVCLDANMSVLFNCFFFVSMHAISFFWYAVHSSEDLVYLVCTSFVINVVMYARKGD